MLWLQAGHSGASGVKGDQLLLHSLFNDPIDSHEMHSCLSCLGTAILEKHWDHSGALWMLTSFSLHFHSILAFFPAFNPPQCHLFLTKTDSGPSKSLLSIWGSSNPEGRAEKKTGKRAGSALAGIINPCMESDFHWGEKKESLECLRQNS